MTEVPGLGPVLGLVWAAHTAVPPPGVDPERFAAAALADSYEVLADLDLVRAGVARAGGRPTAAETDELLWPGDVAVDADADAGDGLRALAARVVAGTEGGPALRGLLVVPADVPDLPGLVPAKLVRGLLRGDVCTAPETGGPGLAGFAVRLPWPEWLDVTVGLDHDPQEALVARAPQRRLVSRAPSWHRLRTPASVHRLDPGLEGWEQTRTLLGG